MFILTRQLGITAEAFAERLGVNLRTIYKWEKRGAPFTSEHALREWMHYQGIRQKAPPDALQDLVAGKPGASPAQLSIEDLAAQEPPVAQPPQASGPGTAQQQLAMRTADLRQTQAAMAQLELEQARREVIKRGDVAAAFGRVGVSFSEALNDLPSMVLGQLPDDFPPDLRAAVRKAVTGSVGLFRDDVPKRIRAALAPLLAEPGT